MGRLVFARAGFRLFGVLSVAGLLFTASARATDVHLNADDTVGTSSFNAAGHWDNAAAPSAGNAYFNALSGTNFLLRTPGSNGNFTFAGDSLTITGAAGDLNDSLLFKGTGGSVATPNTITVNSLVLNSGYIRHASGSGDFFALAGNLTINGGGMAIQGPTYINSLISGAGNLTIESPGNTEAIRTVHFTNSGNTYTGSINLSVGSPNFSKFELDSTGVLNFVIGASGVNNQIFGPGNAIYNGAFKFNLTGASTNLGDTWNVAAATNQTFSGTFSVNGFSSLGGGLWETSANGATYQFNQANGTLTVVPEPTSLMLIAVGSMGLLFLRRK